jgi:hypothetical protein
MEDKTTVFTLKKTFKKFKTIKKTKTVVEIVHLSTVDVLDGPLAEEKVDMILKLVDFRN